MEMTFQERENAGKQNAMECDKAEIFGIPALFFNGRIRAENLPEGLYCYDLRGSDNDPGRPVTVENHVGVNHAGTLVTSEPLNIPDSGYLPLTEDNGLDFQGENCTVQEFQRAWNHEHGAMKQELSKGRNPGKTGKNRTFSER